MSDVPPEWLCELTNITNHFEPRRPLEMNRVIHQEFARLPYDPNEYICFANRYGPLNDLLSDYPYLIHNLLDPRGEWISRIFLEWAEFHSFLRLFLGLSVDNEPEFVRQRRFLWETVIRSEADGRETRYNVSDSELEPRTHLEAVVRRGLLPSIGDIYRPVHLKAAIALNALLSDALLLDGVVLKECLRCNEFFLAGPGQLRKKTSKYCTEDCQERQKESRRADRRRS